MMNLFGFLKKKPAYEEKLYDYDAKEIGKFIHTIHMLDDRPSIANKTNIQQIAIYLRSLDEQKQQKILTLLTEDIIENLTFTYAAMGYVDQTSTSIIVEHINVEMANFKYGTYSDIDYIRSLLEKTFGSQKAIDIVHRLTSSLQVRPFDFVRRTDSSHLLNFIQDEHPQTIALILSYIDERKSSEILKRLHPNVQAGVTKRIATMKRTSPEVLREVERVLERKLSTLASEDFTSAGGIDSVVEVLNLVDRGTEKTIIEALEEEDPELAEEIKKRMFIFEDIILLDDRAIQKVLKEVEPLIIAKALKVVDADVRHKVCRNMSKRNKKYTDRLIDTMQPILLKQVEAAQYKIVNIIKKLEEKKEIIITRAGEEELV